MEGTITLRKDIHSGVDAGIYGICWILVAPDALKEGK